MTGTPRVVARLDGLLTGPSGRDPADIALGYVRDHADVFGLDAGDIAALRPTRRYRSIDGTWHLAWTQQVDGVPALDNGLLANVTADGRLINVMGSPRPDLAVGATRPRLDAAQALAVALQDAGAAGAAGLAPRAGRPRGARRETRFSGGHSAALVLFGEAREVRLAWRVSAQAGTQRAFDYVIDAQTGAVLFRDGTVKRATGKAWLYFPTNGTPWGQAPKDFSAWLPASPSTLDGEFAHAYRDLDDSNTVQAGEEVPPSSGETWDYAMTDANGTRANCSVTYPCSWGATPDDWGTNDEQATTQAFFFVNNFHDYLQAPPIGFTEAAGNFEKTNAPGQGVGGDPVLVETLDGAATGPDPAHTNNANMTTFRDGQSPRMQLFLWAGGGGWPDANATDDASVVYHEYVHGLSNRLVVDANGDSALVSFHGDAMGEGWSDWYAMDYLVGQGLEADTGADGEVLVARYLTGGTRLRTEGLDCPVGSTAPGCPGTSTAGAGGYTLGDMGKVGSGPEVHGDGEIWAQTLWDLRARLIADHGATDGVARARALVTRAMELSPTDPSFLDMRNAILQADAVTTTGAIAPGTDRAAIWEVFKARGMGFYAAVIDASDTSPVENFDGPPASGGPTGTVTGRLTEPDGGNPVNAATVAFAGHDSGLSGDISGGSGADGTYSIADVPTGLYPYLLASAPGHDGTVRQNVTVAPGTNVVDLRLRRDWASLSGGATIVSASGPDYSGFGCGPGGALDISQRTVWASTSPSNPDAPGEKQLVVRLPAAVDIVAFGVDPGAGCGDDDNASTAGYRIETSPDGTAFTQAVSGTFTSADNHRLNLLSPAAGAANVRYVRFTMQGPQSAAGSGAKYMDLTELEVYGTATPPPSAAPPPAAGPVKDVTAPVVTLRLLTGRRLLRALARGLRVRVTSNEAARFTVQALVERRTAKRVGLAAARRSRFTFRVASGARRLSRAGSAVVTVRFTPSARRRLRRLKRLTLALRGTATDGSGNVTRKLRRATLRR